MAGSNSSPLAPIRSTPNRPRIASSLSAIAANGVPSRSPAGGRRGCRRGPAAAPRRPGDRPVAHEVAVAVDALLVVDVLRLQAAQVLELRRPPWCPPRRRRLLGLTLDLVVPRILARCGDVESYSSSPPGSDEAPAALCRVVALAGAAARGLVPAASPPGPVAPVAVTSAPRRPAVDLGSVTCGPWPRRRRRSRRRRRRRRPHRTRRRSLGGRRPAHQRHPGAGRGLLGGVHGLPHLLGDLAELPRLGLDVLDAGLGPLGDRGLQLGERRLDADFSAAGTFSPFSARNFSVE